MVVVIAWAGVHSRLHSIPIKPFYLLVLPLRSMHSPTCIEVPLLADRNVGCAMAQ
jgi:hypothetical protein